MSHHRLILASGSPHRRELLTRLGLDFDVESPDIDETRRPDETPADLARRLSREKAAVVHEHHAAFVIGSDQVIALGDEILSKPGTPERAREQLRRLSGQQHELITGVCVIAPDGQRAESLTTFAMRMRELDDAEIAAYVAADAPLDCAGSYRIEARGIGLFESLRGDDYTAIVGLPLTRVRAHLAELGYFGESE